MSSIRTWRLIHIIFLVAILRILVFAQDIRNSQDHPVISRYPGQTIHRYDVKEFDQYNLVLSVDKTGARRTKKEG